MKHLKYFPNSQAIGGGVKVDLPNVSYLEGENTLFITGNEGQATVIVNNTTGEIELEPDYSQMYLTFEAIESGTFKFSGITSAHTLSYSLDDGATWTSLAHNTNTPTINAGNKIMWKGNLTPKSYDGIGNFVATGKFDACGNVMSLLYGDNFVGQISLEGKTSTFLKLFVGNTKIVGAQNLILPATTLAYSCYESMFDSCISLTTAPALPATTLVTSCYNTMFSNCALTTAPALPATTLATACYSSMFNGCTLLTTAPALPATTLAEGCYGMMFYGCKSLTTAPALPAATLAEDCYLGMLNGCTNINYIKMLAISITARYSLDNWVNGVSPTGTFVKAAGVTIPTGTSGIPSGWTVVEV